ncbi:hypothetical protein GH741_09725 [Aquibacillus halophilus]|uniref:Uncharacterized protein n=1 Tax=Aquibacillus halophilus TaxID=930132 RepID=A0A6A8DB69_9BACI|nr:PilX N-terminal domain-containing pilus assembly protein [Aquibacillus halophilus]MRH42963.1 hypothetical protein [Aquibacillus halophilus]
MKRNLWRRVQILLNNERGVTLVMVLMVLMVLSVLGLGLLGTAVSNANLSSVDRDHQSTYYIAEAGATERLSEIKSKVAGVYDETSNEAAFYNQLENEMLGSVLNDKFEPHFGDQPQASVNVEIETVGNPRKYKIISLGTIGKRTRTVERMFTVDWQPKGGLNIPQNMAAYTNTTISLTGGATIDGNIGTNSSEANSIELKGGASIINGVVYVPEPALDIALDNGSDVDVSVSAKPPTPLKLPPFPNIPTFPVYPDSQVDGYNVIENGALRVNQKTTNGYVLNLTDNTSFTEIEIKNDKVLTINTNNSDKTIVVDDLYIQQGNLNIEGSGKLTIYVLNSISMGGGGTINDNGDIGKLNIYYSGTDEVKLAGSQKIYGSLFAESADINITGGSGFLGHILTGGNNLEISGSTYIPTLFFAPNADVQLKGGGEVEGAIISHSLSAVGGTNLKFSEPDTIDIPFGSNTSGDSPENLLQIGTIKEK